MNNKILIWVVVVALVFFGVTIALKNNQAEQINFENDRENAIEKEVQRPEKTITSKYQYRDGKHIFVGNVVLPSPCHSYNAEVKDTDGSKEIVITISNPVDEACAAVITERNFKVEFEGPEDQEIFASLNGEVVNLNIFTIPEDEDINDIEIFFKG